MRGTMSLTLFSTPVVNTLLRAFSVGYLHLAGWKVEGTMPGGVQRCVLIAAPHTSNWDLPYTLMAAFALRLNVRWMGKHTLFRFPFGGLMRWLGGIAVQREQRHNLVAASAASLREGDGAWQLVVPPEGTRSATRHWKTGFYYIAQGAGVPIVMAYLDFGQRRLGLGPVLVPTGDIEADMATVKAFYAPIRGKNARQFDAG